MKNLAIVGLLTASLVIAAAPALAKDRDYGQDKHRDKYSARQQHDYGKHDNQSHDRRYYSSHKYGHKSREHYSNHHRYYGNQRYYSRQRYYYRNNDYVEDYFAVLGGTILINELLHHSHDYH